MYVCIYRFEIANNELRKLLEIFIFFPCLSDSTSRFCDFILLLAMHIYVHTSEYNNRRFMLTSLVYKIFIKLQHFSPPPSTVIFSNKNRISSCRSVFRYNHKTHLVIVSYSSIFKTQYSTWPRQLSI